MTLIIRCASGVVAWIARTDGRGVGSIRCVQDGTEYPMSSSVDETWGEAMRQVVTHSVQLRGAFQDLWVLPTRI